MIPITTIPFLLVIALACFLKPRLRVLALGGLMAFTDAAIIVEPVALSVSWVAFIALLCSSFLPDLGAMRRRALTLAGILVIGLCAYDLVAILLTGAFFTHQFIAMPNTALFKISLASAVELVPAHFNQFVYLCLGALVTIAVPASMDRRGPAASIEFVENLLIGFTLTASFIAFWQFASYNSPIPYPSDFIHSGARVEIADAGQGVGGARRIFGPFQEPSTLGNLVGQAVCFLLARPLTQKPALLRFVTIGAGLIALLISTSTTALAAVGLAAVILPLSFIARPFFALTRRSEAATFASSRFSDGIVLFTVGSLTILFSMYLLSQPHTMTVLNTILFEKDRSNSFIERSYSNIVAKDIFTETYGLGIGFGGHVASNLFLTVAACGGFVGLICFGYFFVMGLLCPLGSIKSSMKAASFAERTALVDGRIAISCMLAGCFVVNALSGANVNNQFLWFAFGTAAYFFSPSLTPLTKVRSARKSKKRLLLGRAPYPGRAVIR